MTDRIALTNCDPRAVPAAANVVTAEWRLRVDGLAQRPAALTLSALLALPATPLARDYLCRGARTVPGLRWRGVALADLLAHVGLQPGASKVRIGCEGYSIAIPISQLAERPFLLAYEMNDQPLTRETGGPLRLVAPENHCAHAIKWVDQVIVTA